MCYFLFLNLINTKFILTHLYLNTSTIVFSFSFSNHYFVKVYTIILSYINGSIANFETFIYLRCFWKLLMDENVRLIISDGYRDRFVMQDCYLSALEWISSLELQGVVSSFSVSVAVWY